MNAIQFTDAYVVLPVNDMNKATDFYTKLFGRSPDSSPMPTLVQWALPGERTLQVTQSKNHSGGGMATLVVKDIEQARQILAESGIAFDFDDRQSEYVKFGTLNDPDGNELTLVEPKADSSLGD